MEQINQKEKMENHRILLWGGIRSSYGSSLL